MQDSKALMRRGLVDKFGHEQDCLMVTEGRPQLTQRWDRHETVVIALVVILDLSPLAKDFAPLSHR